MIPLDSIIFHLISVPDDTTKAFKSEITNKAIDYLIKILRLEKFFPIF